MPCSVSVHGASNTSVCRHVKGDVRDWAACCLTVCGAPVPPWTVLPCQCLGVPSTAPHVTTDCARRKDSMVAFFVFLKFLVKHYIHEEKEQGLTI